MKLTVQPTFVRCCAVSMILALPISSKAQVDYVKDVRPILEQHCYQCHGPEKQKSSYRLDRRDIAFKGGEFGEPAIVPSQAGESPLLKYVRGEVDGTEMPPKESGIPPLNEQQVATLQSWIEQGAVWPDEHSGIPGDSGPHWSLAPLAKPDVPNVESTTGKSSAMNPVDAFIMAKLREKNLNPLKPADRRTLIRRVTFDLIGLPPTPEEITAFVNDTSPDAWRTLVDRLLASPHYGERWGRHWLDVVRYTESNGFEYDRIRDNAWHYRDYVIKSFNDDKPYDQFMKEQVAGDVLSPVNRDGIVATSLLVCGPYDQAGNAQQNQTQRMITREDELEDVVGVVGQTFLGLTVNCARCHSHKFDPIPQAEYYQIKSVFEGVKHGERIIATPEEIRQQKEQRKTLEEQLVSASKDIVAIDAEGAKLVAASRKVGDIKPGPAPFSRWSFDASAKVDGTALSGELIDGAMITDGRLVLPKDGAYVKSKPLTKDIREKTLEAWVQLSTLDQGGGAVISLQTNDGRVFDAIVFGERQARKWTAGSDGFLRTKDLGVPDEADAATSLVHVAIAYRADNSIQLYRNGQSLGSAYTPGSGLQTFKAGEAHVVLGLRHSGGGRPWLTGSIQRAALYDRALSDEEILQSFEASGFTIPHSEILAALTPDQRARRDEMDSLRKKLKIQIDAMPKDGPKSYVGVRFQPQPTHRLKRGDVLSPDEVVTPGALTAVSTVRADFGLPVDAPESERRICFANWLADPANPLPARVIANRFWQFHFGQGLVTTPNDFGTSGAKPSHPELLDWLASTLIENKWSLKQLHRVIVNSATYQQSSDFNEAAAAIDADNQLLWRYPPRRLEAEAIRDAMLVASGRLDRTMGGPGFRSFIMTEFNGTSYTPTDGPQFDRRTVYRMNVNSGKDPLLDSFDCPDPSIKTPRRGVTTTPLQALELMNNAFVVRQANHLAERVLAEAKDDEPTAIRLAWQHTLGRQPTDEELTRAVTALKSRGLKNVCWVLMNSTEFVYLR
jgi:mono/diheme cytochrome c family protein